MAKGAMKISARGCLRPRIVSAFGPHDQLAVAFHFGFDSDLPEAAAGPGIRWLVANGVLIANVVRDLPADLVYFIQRLREKRQAAGALGDDFQCPLGSLGMFFIS